MRGTLVEITPEFLEERARLGHDVRDEMWDGEVHLVPQPYVRHQELETELIVVLHPLARRHGLRLAPELGFYRVDNDYRVPDLIFYRPDQASERGVERQAELVFEILSPRDESRIKLPWYIDRCVREVVFIDRDTRAVELWMRGEDGVPEQVDHTRSEVLGCEFERVGDNHLRVVTDAGAHDIVL